jgi:methyltransferase (TIGR00027 family)
MRADRPSSTARLILRSLLLSAQHPAYRRLLPAGDVAILRRFLTAAGRAAWFDFSLRHPSAARWLWRLEHAVLPGIFLHYLARKRWFETQVTGALAQGTQQVVVLGGGFDPLAARLHRDWRDAFFCELDHPATQRPKAEALARASTGENLAFQPADLGGDLPSAALRRQPRFSPLRATVYVAEGLLMYFAPERVAELLRDLPKAPGSSLAFSFMAPGPDGRAAFRGSGRSLISAWLRLVQEPFAWAIDASQLEAFLARIGWKVAAICGAAELRTQFLAPAGLGDEPLAEGEYLCHAVAL